MASIATSGTGIWIESGGDSGGKGQTLVLLHGLGANGTVWNELLPIVRARWHGRWLNLDLRGHGRSGHAAPYGYAGHAADVAAAIGGQDAPVALIGHSMGGVVALALASGWFGVRVERVLGFGMKIVWTTDEIAKMKQLGEAPMRWFGTREEAIDRYLKVSGLIGLVAPDSERAAVGISEAGGRYRLASDPRINGAVGPQVEDFYRLASMGPARLRLAAGERDPMVTKEHMTPMDPHAVVIPGAGHNVHIEKPDAVWELFEAMA